MVKNARPISLDELEYGMVIMQDIVSENGNVLLQKGFMVYDVEKVKEFLEKHGVLETYILVESPYKNEAYWEENQVHIFERSFYSNKQHFIENSKKLLFNEKIDEFEIKSIVSELIETTSGSLNAFQLLQKLTEEDDTIYTHAFYVLLVSRSLGSWLKLPKKLLDELSISALFSDIGKSRIDKEILNKVEPLTLYEKSQIQSHVFYSKELLQNYSFINDNILDGIFMHHEREDGSGYPNGLNSSQICVFAKIIAIADIYCALIQDRPYRTKKHPIEAIAILEKEYKTKLDIRFLYTFLRKISEKYIGSKVMLSNSLQGKITFFPKFNLSRPIIKLETGDILDLSEKENSNIFILAIF